MHAALDMIDAAGVEALSMRKLGQAVGRDPMRLYSHAQSKAALLDAVAELVLEDFVMPAAVDGDWEKALRTAANSFRDIALVHPHMVPLLVTRPLGPHPPAGRQRLANLLLLLTDAGFDDTGALYAYRLFTGFLAGHLLWEIQELAAEREPPAPVPDLHRYNGQFELELGLDIVLTGLRGRLQGITNARLSK